MSVNNSLVCYLLEKFGSDFLKEKYLKPLASGKKLGAFSLSEPQSGSDASNMRTIAKKREITTLFPERKIGLQMVLIPIMLFYLQ